MNEPMSRNASDFAARGESAARPSRPSDVISFFFLACAITWALDAPFALAILRNQTPPPYALPLAGLGAFGPTFAALGVALFRGERRGMLGRIGANPLWLLAGLLLPGAMHLVATLLHVALGGTPAQWFYPPVKPEHVVAMVMFSVGEEIGWRGFAYPRITKLVGPVFGSLVVGGVWGIWHIAMMVTPENGAPTAFSVGLVAVELALYSVVLAWVFEKTNRSLLAAMAVHAGAHLDNVNRAPETEVQLRALRLLVALVVAGFAARALWKQHRKSVLAFGGEGE